jgi:hypothetical protein
MRPQQGDNMLTEKEIAEMTPEEFSKNWNNNNIQDAMLKILGRRPMTPEEEEYVNTHE